MNIRVIIAAAGVGRRYQAAGGRLPKLLHPMPDGRSLFQTTLDNVLAAGFAVTVVTRPEYDFIPAPRGYPQPEVIRLASKGLGETIAAGVRHCTDCDGWLIMLADMPWITSRVLQETAAALQHHLTVRTVFNGQPGHPVGFQAALRQPLQALQGDDGAKSILIRYPPHAVVVSAAGVIADIDTPAADQ
ncbi:hypothetical protein BL250_02750 [Erwinia sp. OLTSP20]|uniref:nucleotidyltransferase family protein n=1 Tax=unclassified Erwinia TaxID=2622719 RepID=UPI000C179D20|nr:MULTISPECIES: nucleotidyltransferase family protein [unclassified Erwinia]PIJ51901.1 hypothetical protein BV501_01650 [Erwinia sp. OAMSP11]PIJ74774.1 hypothetical protein BK416_02985 [Erwinia sp. OLSSP12]PIJ85160.1 hypothetical protein BLD47_00725 [Erwinia sp. OLCASP19]PIJ87161.1 hypothetical protein BLD46_01120 [Erwinia sp. OLMTSP26]PIJ88305.1 hypothetical protein BLD49_02175 [Erwinia sp. OLMDSP33]